MMNKKNLIVFVDSSTKKFYMAIKDLKTAFFRMREFTQKELKGEAMLSVLKEMLQAGGYTVEDIKLLCTTSGPGSLTGLRICMSTLKTMAQVLDIPIVALPTLYALESSCHLEKTAGLEHVVTILQARKNHYYIRERQQERNGFSLIDGSQLEAMMNEDTFYIVEENSTPAQFCDKSNIKFVNIELNPEIIMDLFLQEFNAGHFQNYLTCLPEYGGKSVAEINYENRNKKM